MDKAVSTFCNITQEYQSELTHQRIALSLVLGQEVFTATFGDLTQYLYTAQLYMAKADLIGGRAFALPFAAALLFYIVLPAAVSVAAFRKQELEF